MFDLKYLINFIVEYAREVVLIKWNHPTCHEAFGHPCFRYLVTTIFKLFQPLGCSCFFYVKFKSNIHRLNSKTA